MSDKDQQIEELKKVIMDLQFKCLEIELKLYELKEIKTKIAEHDTKLFQLDHNVKALATNSIIISNSFE